MPINNPLRLELRPLRIDDIPQLAAIVPNTQLLLLVEGVKPRRQGVDEVAHVAVRVQGSPGADARLRLAGLEHEEERVQARHGLFQGDAQERGRGEGSLVWVEDVVELAGVGL